MAMRMGTIAICTNGQVPGLRRLLLRSHILHQGDRHDYDYAGICYYDPHYEIWKWIDGWCDKGSEAVTTLVGDGCYGRRLKGKPEGTPGRGPPIEPLGKVPDTEIVEI